jgi:hypothetical protein
MVINCSYLNVYSKLNLPFNNQGANLAKKQIRSKLFGHFMAKKIGTAWGSADSLFTFSSPSYR